MKKVVFLFGMVLGGFLHRGYSQTLADTFQNFIPPAAASDETTKRQISAQLAYLGELHPDLIYHYFYSLTVLFTQPGSAQAETAYRRFNALKHHFELRRETWAKKQRANLNKQDSPYEVIALVTRHLEKLYTDSTAQKTSIHSDFSVNADSLNYLVVQYYQRNQRLEYISAKDYLGQRQALEAKFRASFTKTLSNLSVIPKLEHHALSRKFLRYWFLYEDQPGEISDFTFASKFLLTLEEHYYSLRDIPNDLVKPPRFAIAGGLYQNKTYHFVRRVPIVELNRDLLLNKPTKFPQQMIAIQSRWPLRKYLTVFSHLSLQLGRLNSTASEDFTFNNNIERFWVVKDTMTKITTYYEESTKFTKGKASINQRESYLGRVNLPIIVINKHLWLEAGISISRNRITQQVQYNYRYKLVETKSSPTGNQTTRVLKDGASGDREQKQTLTRWFVSPNLGCVIQLPYRLTMEISLFKKYTTLIAGFTLF